MHCPSYVESGITEKEIQLTKPRHLYIPNLEKELYYLIIVLKTCDPQIKGKKNNRVPTHPPHPPPSPAPPPRKKIS